MRVLALVILTCVVLHAWASAQTLDELTEQLSRQSGIERARTLAALTDALRQDKPTQAIVYGEEALALFARHPDPHNEVRTLNEMAWAYMTLSDYGNAVAFAERGRGLAETHRDVSGRARAVNNLGVIAQRRGDALRAVEYFSESLNAYRALGRDLEVANALNNLGFVYSTALADYEVALSHHLEALRVRERLGDQAAIALSLNNIGIVYHRLGDLDSALAHYERSLAIRRQLGGDNRIASTLHNIGDTYFDKREFARALATHREALELRRTIGDRAGIAHSLRNIGVTEHELGDRQSARRHLREALAIATAAGDHTIVAQSRLGLSTVERASGSPQRAVEHAREALHIAERINNLELTRRALEQLAASQEKAQDYRAALASLRRFHEVNTRIFDADRSRRLEQLDRKYQTEHREAELAQLRAEQTAAALELSQQTVVRNAVIAAAVLFGLTGLGLYRRRVEAARLHERLSVTDTLTGLKNRRYVIQTVESDVNVAVRRHGMAAATGDPPPPNSDLLFVLVDIDDFKSINDQYGHKAGDMVLEQVADVLRATCRTSDTIARWGGEEFLAVLRFTNRETAPISVERIRMAVEQRLFDIGNGRTIGVTCSIGFAPFPLSPERPDAAPWEQVVALADDALYRAKQAGRNTWVGADATRTAAQVVR